jgi:outer membrane receptor for ferrienterochelin and colicin
VSLQEVVILEKTFKAKQYTVFAQDIWDITAKDHFRYGLRGWSTDFQEFGSGVDPRVAYVRDFSDDFSLSLAVGRYSQLPQTLFVIDGFGNPKIDTFEFADHYTLSFQKKFADTSSLVIEPYFKTFENLAINDDELNYKAVGEGEAYGVDITYKKQIDKFDIMAAYTFVKAKRQLYSDNSKQYRFEGDIPHTLQLSTNYRFDNGWRVSSFFKYNDGAPYTPIIATEDYAYKGKNYKRPIYGEPYSKRLPSNFDLDIQIGKTIKYAKAQSLEFSIELMNVTSLLRENVAGIDYNDNYEEDGEYHQMGFLPAFHVNYRF